MRREIFYDEHNEVWRSTEAFGIIDDGVYTIRVKEYSY